MPCRTNPCCKICLLSFDCTPPRRAWLHLLTPTWELKTAIVFPSSPGQINPAPSAVPFIPSHSPTILVTFCLTCSTVSWTEGPKLDTLHQMWSPRCWTEGSNWFSRPAAHGPASAACYLWIVAKVLASTCCPPGPFGSSLQSCPLVIQSRALSQV